MKEVDEGWIRNCVKGAQAEGLGNSVPQYGLSQIPGRGLGDEVLQKREQNVKLEYNF